MRGWINEAGKRGDLNIDFSNEAPPEDFSGFISVVSMFKLATTKKLGFELNYVMIDRGFYQAELLKEIKDLKGEVLIPSRSYRKINNSI